MNANLARDPLVTLLLSLSIPEQARLCDALLASLERPKPGRRVDVDVARVIESERTLAAIDEAIDELPTNTKLEAFVAHVEGKLAAPRD